MEISIELPIGDEFVRFTPDGMVFIEDAIKVLSGVPFRKSDAVWEKMKNDYPGILTHCSEYLTNEGFRTPITDLEGLDEIFKLLPEYIGYQ